MKAAARLPSGKPTGTTSPGLIAFLPRRAQGRDADRAHAGGHQARTADVGGRPPGSAHATTATRQGPRRQRTARLSLSARKPRHVYLFDGSARTPKTPGGSDHHGVGCLYIKDLEQIDLDVLRGILERSLAWVEAGGTSEVQLTVTG